MHTGNIEASPYEMINVAVYPCAYREHGDAGNKYQAAWRFIPVHTGNIDWFDIADPILTVYPCAYREHHNLHRIFRRIRGLSLCIQGTLYQVECYKRTKRFIPVHTGNIISAC